MDWISPKNQLPPQGKKILYLKDGNVYVVQRFGKYWFPIPFYDSKYSFHEEPELWADIYLPGKLTGKIHFLIGNNEYHDIDSLEIYHPEVYKQLIESHKKLWVKKNGLGTT